jgi:hypothetical protein
MGHPRELIIFNPRSEPAELQVLVTHLLSAFLHPYAMKNTPHMLEENQVSIQSAECGWKGGIEQATLADWALFLEFLRRVRERLSAPLRPQILNLSRQNNILCTPFQRNETAAYFSNYICRPAMEY